jgi:hypothetical protein
MTYSFGACVALFFTLSVSIASAQGLVPCDGPDCNLGSLFKLGNNLTTFFIGFGVLYAVIMISYAGFKLVTSAGKGEALSEAKSLIWNVLVGFLIIVLAVLVVNVVLKVLTGGGFEYWDLTPGR